MNVIPGSLHPAGETLGVSLHPAQRITLDSIPAIVNVYVLVAQLVQAHLYDFIRRLLNQVFVDFACKLVP